MSHASDTAKKRRIRIEPLNWLLIAVPIALALKWSHAGAVWVFVASCVAVIPLAGLMGRATESLAETLGPGIGGLLNATFGNAAELIIALMALAKGPAMYPLIKASLTGSIIGNVLLVLGLSVVAGGMKHKRQTFNRTAAGLGATLMALACVGLILPTIYHWLLERAPVADGAIRLEHLSEEIAGILALTYVLSLVFSLRTHQHLFAGEGEEKGDPADTTPIQGHTSADKQTLPHEMHWSRRTSIIVLLAATAGIALMSEMLVGSVESAAHALGFNAVFVGVIVVAIIGNAAEHSTAVLVAMKNKMDLSVNIAVGSSIQIALFVAPVLVFVSMVMHPAQPLDLHFTALEIVAVVISIAVLALVCNDGESHWMEGVMLLAVYAMLALAFYHLPDGGAHAVEPREPMRAPIGPTTPVR